MLLHYNMILPHDRFGQKPGNEMGLLRVNGLGVLHSSWRFMLLLLQKSNQDAVPQHYRLTQPSADQWCEICASCVITVAKHLVFFFQTMCSLS